MRIAAARPRLRRVDRPGGRPGGLSYWALVACGACGLAAERFDVAVIRASTASANAGTSVNLFEGGRIKISNEPVKLLVRMAFGVQNAEIVGGPGWIESDRYDIEAKTGRPEKITPEELRPLMQNLLVERFHLKFHRETRELSVYALAPAKGGAKLKPQTEGESTATNTTGGPKRSEFTATAVSMQLLAAYVGNRLGRIVVDRTELNGSYDFKLEWAPEESADSAAQSLVTALREQLGLRLETVKSPVEVLVIDGIERPSDN